MPHLDEETVNVLFLKAANAIFGERDSIREDYEAVKERLYDTSELEAERIQLQEEMNIVAEMIQQCVNENARVALDQTECQKKYGGLAERFDRIKERLEAVGIAITERLAKREKTERFLAELEVWQNQKVWDKIKLYQRRWEDRQYSNQHNRVINAPVVTGLTPPLV